MDKALHQGSYSLSLLYVFIYYLEYLASKIVENSEIEITKLPSYYFNPEHYSGAKYLGDFQPFGYHYWITAKKVFNSNGNS